VIDEAERKCRARQAAETRAATIAATPRMTRPGSETTVLRVGDKVRAARTTPRSGTWAAYEGRQGWVTAVNRQTFPDGSTYVEIGVAWHRGEEAGSQIWFRADELEAVA